MIIGASIIVDRMGYCACNDLVVVLLLMFFALFFLLVVALGENERIVLQKASLRERVLEKKRILHQRRDYHK